MDTKQIDKPLRRFVLALSQEIQVDAAIVFGSYLEGSATSESDIDLIVVSEDFSGLTEDQRLDILERFAEGIEPYIHAWGFTTSEMEAAGRLTTLGHARDVGLRVELVASSRV